MFRNLFKIAFRNIIKEKTYSAINIFGLTIGITCSLFLLMYIMDELSFDKYHKDAENIYRIVADIKEPDNAFKWAVTQPPLAEELRNNYPEVINAVKIDRIGREIFKNGEKKFYESDFMIADSTVFDIFTYSFLGGDPATALDFPHSIVVSEEIAIKYFGAVEAALGQSLQNSRNEEFKVTGVIRRVPMNSHLRFDALLSRERINAGNNNNSWGGFGVFTYIQLPAGYAPSKMDASLDKIVKER